LVKVAHVVLEISWRKETQTDRQTDRQTDILLYFATAHLGEVVSNVAFLTVH